MVVLPRKNIMKRTIWIEIDFSAKNGGFTTKTGLYVTNEAWRFDREKR